jgi:myo-inositol-1(or 4)-monophosphatase
MILVMNYAEIYAHLEPLCKKAGDIALKYRKEGLEVEHKNDREEILAVVTIADKEIDTLLRETLTNKYPDFGWLSEETEDNLDRLSKEHVWIVDPIDGTKSYIDGTDYYAVSIGLVKNGVPVLGMIYNPAKNELFGAYRGSGVFYNGEKVAPTYSDTMQDATCLVSCNETKKGLWAPFNDVLQTKSVHSIAYKLAVATLGKGDSVATLKPKSEWDVAAGHLLCSEAGLCVTDLSGKEIFYNNENVEIKGFVVAPKNWQPDLQNLLSNR